MSAQYDNTNRGVLFKNDRKESEKHPDYKGNVNVDGAEFWLDAWIKKSKDGTKTFMSLSVKPKLPGGQKKTESARDREQSEFGDTPF